MKIIFRILITAGALLFCAYLVPGISVSSFGAAVVAAIILGLLNLIARPILVLLTLPITLLTLGLFIFVINAALFAAAASLVSGFSVDGFVPALFGLLLVSIVSVIGNRFVK
ncbi:phage holin family protein [Candidatus Kaiserbacteria bacterium]|nr:phage holin family protein [Candidatus Kaiserbacteria bacterium]